jgi:transposase
MYIESVPNRNSPPTVLLRESFREDGKVKKRTLANLSVLPGPIVEQLRILLRGGRAIEQLEDSIEVSRSLPHGHVAAVLGTALNLGVDRIISGENERQLQLVMAMIVARVIDPKSKLATARGFNPDCAFSSLGEMLGVVGASEDELYSSMDWLLERQEQIENALSAKHLTNGTLVLYDVTSTYFEGHSCPLARLGHNRDGKKGKLQIVIGLLCSASGCPVAIEVFEGNTADPKTLQNQITKLRVRFGLERIVLVGDRGMITAARIREELKKVEGFDWITALRAPQIAELVKDGQLQLSLFDIRDMAEITHPDYPNERLVVCRNPYLAYERMHKREALMLATEKELDKIVDATTRNRRRLKGKDKIGIRVGKVLGKYKMAKHFVIQIGEDHFTYEIDHRRIADESALDGIYVIRTSVQKEIMSAAETVSSYKSLSNVERAFRSMKSVDLKVRPIYHHLSDRVKAHVFLCMLSYYVEWHMRQVLSPILFDDDDKAQAQLMRESVVSPSERSRSAKRKAQDKVCSDGLPVHSFQTLLSDLGTIAKNKLVIMHTQPVAYFEKITSPTRLQQKALDLLGVKL